MNNRLCATILALSIAFFGVALQVLADPTRNPPLVCAAKASCSTCPTKDGCACGCILVTLDLGATTAWTGQTPVYLRIHSSDETASLSTPAQLKVVMGWSFKAVDGGTTAGGAPQIVRFVQPEGAELVVHFQDGDAVGVPEPNNLGKSLARVQMVDAEGWATTSAPAFYDLYPGDGSVWRFLATGNTNERGALVSFTDPRGRVLTPDDFGVDIVRDALGNIRQVKTLTRLADVRTLSPTHYAVTVYPLAEEPEQVADTGLYALPEHAPTRVLDVAQGESVKELLVGFQKGTGDMRQYRYVAVNGDWTLHQPSGLVEAQELYFTEDESGAQRLHTIRDETGKLWSRDEYNYVSAYWGYLITNRIEGIPGDATRTTSWSYYTDGPHKDLLRETVEPTGNRILYEYDDKNRVVRESMPLVEEETLYSYEPVDPSDPSLLCDTRPRCVVRKMQGIEIQRTYYVYGTNGVDVVERVGEQGAAYGGTNVLRTVTTYYPVTGAITDGLVQSVRHEDGTIDNYAYGLTDGVWTETVTHVHEQAPAIVPMRTTRSVRVRNALGQLVDSRTDLCTIGVEDLVPQADWTPIERLQYAYDVDGNEIRREDLAGRLWTAEWAGNCCGKVSETDWQGITTTYAYDVEGNIVSLVSLVSEPVETQVERDALGRIMKLWTTNRVTGLGTPITQIEYDSLGRRTATSDHLGQWTRYYYPSESRIEANYPSGATEFVETFNNRILEEGGTARPPRFYKYGVETNGIRNLTQFHGNNDASGEWEQINIDLFGEDFERIRPFPGLYKGGEGYRTGLVHQVTYYDSFGQLRGRSVYLENRREFPYPPVPVGQMDPISRKGYVHDWTRGQWLFFSESLDRLGGHETENGSVSAPPEISDVPQFEPDGRDPAEVKTEGWIIHQGNVWKSTILSSFGWFGDSRLKTNSIVLTKLTGLVNGSSETMQMESGLWSSRIMSVNREEGQVTIRNDKPTSNQPETICRKNGITISKTDVLGNVTWYQHDSLGRLSSWSNLTGRVYSVTRNDHGEIVEELDSLTGTVRYQYDEFGRVVAKVLPSGRILTTSRDVNGRETERSGDQVHVKLGWDAEGRLASRATFRSADESSDIFQFSYCDSGAGIQTIRFPSSRTEYFHYAPDGDFRRVLIETPGNPTPNWHSWRVESGPNAGIGPGDRWIHHEWRCPFNPKLPDGSESYPDVMEYLTRDGKISAIDAFWYRTVLNRDEQGRLTNEVQNIRMKTNQNDFGVVEFAAASGGRIIDYEHNGRGLISAERIDGALLVRYGYDEEGRCSSVSISNRTFEISYHPGTTERAVVSVGGFEFATDRAARPVRKRMLVGPSGDCNGEWIETLDEDGAVRTRHAAGLESGNLDLTFVHNRRGELCEVSGYGPGGPIQETFLYDAAGNLVEMERTGRKKTFSVDCDGQVRRIDSRESSFVPSHDCAGGQTEILTATGLWSTCYEAGSLPLFWSNSTDCVYYRKGAVDRLAQRISVLGPDGFALTNEFFHARGRLSLVTSNDVPVARFYWTPEEGDRATLLAVQDEEGMKFVLTDWNNNPIGWVNLDNGDCSRIDYDVWGAERSDRPLPWIGLCSQLSDRQVGCVLFRHRAYNPEDGRWTAPDPLPVLSKNPRHLADYRYLENDPVSGWDIGGLIVAKGCSPDQEQKIKDGIQKLCGEVLQNTVSCCFSKVNITAGPKVFIGFSFCRSKEQLATKKVGCTTREQCEKTGETTPSGVRCGFICKHGSEISPLCGDLEQNIPYFCPAVFDGTCPAGPGCTFFHETSHALLMDTQGQEEMIRKMENCLTTCGGDGK